MYRAGKNNFRNIPFFFPLGPSCAVTIIDSALDFLLVPQCLPAGTLENLWNLLIFFWQAVLCASENKVTML